MRPLLSIARALRGCRRAATAVEYGLIAALIVVAIIAAIISLATVSTEMWNDVSNKVQATN